VAPVPGSRMRVLVFSQHFAPEVTAARYRIEEFTRALVGRGHEVDVVCAVPNHPEGIVRPEYRGRMVVRRRVAGARTSYVWVWTSRRKSLPTRLAYYGSYAAMATAVGALSARPDVILASSPPLSVGAAGAVAARRHRVPWVLDVRDLWPQAAVALGELENPHALRLAERLEEGLYESAAAIVTVTEPFREHIAARASEARKIELIPNGTTAVWLDAAEQDIDRASLGLPEDRFIWAYAGNVGLSYGLESAIDAAGLLDDGFQLLIIGEGPMRSRLMERAAALPAGRVAFRDLMPSENAARHLRAADALLVPHKRILDKVVTSKLFDCCAVGRPVIVAAEGEMRRLAAEADAALGVAAEDPKALAAAVRRLREDPELRARLSERGRAFAAGYLRERQANRLVDLIESQVDARPG
jgi:colanic acid biosynthesis glycosyl transferase WcaI